MISGYCHGVNEISTLVRFYTTQNCSLLATIRDSPIFKSQPIGCPETSVTKYHSILRKTPEECGHQELYNLYL
jgi:hypothetical protein